MAASVRLDEALTPSTFRAYESMFRLYLGFLSFHGLNLDQVNTFVFLAYLEFLHCNQKSHSVMRNHISAIKWYVHKGGISLAPYEDARVLMFVKSVQKSSPLAVKLKAIIDPDTLRAIVRSCEDTYMGLIFKSMYLLGFFSFLRLSNLVPHSVATFDCKKHLAQGDIFFKDNSAVILVKWSKTMQLNNQVKLITIPKLNNDICPVSALRDVLALTPGGSNTPLFQFKEQGVWVPMTDTRVRRHLKSVLQNLNFDTSTLTFHSFRRSGATFAFQNNVALQHIKNHGTWSTDCVWRYVVDSADAGSAVAMCFANLLS